MDIKYKVIPTFTQVHKDTNPYIFVMGPVGSGKSSGCIFHLLFNAMKQVPDENKVRHSRYLVIRATYPALKSTVIKSWIEWFKDKITITYSTPIIGKIQFPLGDGTSIDMEIFFIAVDDARSAEKLRSLEATGVHVNEASEINPDIFDILKTRFDRYPAKRSGGCVDPFIIMDYNAVSTDHWLYKLAEEQKPPKHSFYKQPPAVIKHVSKTGEVSYTVNQEADNMDNHNDSYYENMLYGGRDDFIEVNLMNNYGEIRTGRPVYKDYIDSEHCLGTPLVPLRGVPVVIGIDLGLTPAAAFTQQQYDGTVLVFDEITTEDCSIQEFAEDLLWPKITTKYPYIVGNFKLVVDPAAVQRAMTDKKSSYHLLKEKGFNVKLAKTNDPTSRLESVITFLRKRGMFKLSCDCRMLRKGFIAEYKYKQISGNSSNYKDKPEKNEYSHIHDALQYAMLEYIHKPDKRVFANKTRRYEVASMIGGY